MFLTGEKEVNERRVRECKHFLRLSAKKHKLKFHFGDCSGAKNGRDILIAPPEMRNLLLISSSIHKDFFQGC